MQAAFLEHDAFQCGNERQHLPMRGVHEHCGGGYVACVAAVTFTFATFVYRKLCTRCCHRHCFRGRHRNCETWRLRAGICCNGRAAALLLFSRHKLSVQQAAARFRIPAIDGYNRIHAVLGGSDEGARRADSYLGGKGDAERSDHEVLPAAGVHAGTRECSDGGRDDTHVTIPTPPANTKSFI
jgi:hypothetical protein